jgi:hypothetical protein
VNVYTTEISKTIYVGRKINYLLLYYR